MLGFDFLLRLPWELTPNSRPGHNSESGLQGMETETRVLQDGENVDDLVDGRRDQEPLYFIRPSLPTRIINRLYGWVTRLGFGLPNSYVLQVSGRKTGKIRSVPVNVLSYNGKVFLVATRGSTQWSRNVLANRNITLRRGRLRTEFRVRVVLAAEKPKIIKAYVTRFRWMVRRFFPVPAGAPSASFAPIADRYPVFELIRL
jgi:deazaflavin-dependent oxidoreductase (nitroreductase family)